MTEQWKDIAGFEGYYQVSDMGNVRSLDRMVNHARGGTALKKGKSLTKTKIWSGYEKVCLAKNGRPFSRSVHSLVCESFHGPRPTSNHQVSHGNGVRNDNRASNLRWATPKENNADMLKHGTRLSGFDWVPVDKRPRGESHGCAKLTEPQVVEARKIADEFGIGKHRMARLLGITPTAASYILRRKTWSHI